jgi:FOG: WD40 repeat
MGAGKWDGNNPWLGLSTYQEGVRLYGRDTEVSTLVDIVCNNLATVVFGRSGIGKSSLIHAGISPEIRKKGMMPIYIRFEHNTDNSYIHQIEKAVCKELEKEDQLGDQVPQMGLWDFFHRNVFYNKKHQQTIPVIIVDQFEEIYTLADADHKHLAQELFDELADLLNNVKPSKVIAYKTETIKFTNSKVEMAGDDVLTLRIHSAKRLNYIGDSNFHVVICLREDYLYYLERNTSKIPSLKINRFSLQALDRKSAEDVIMLPKPGLFNVDEADDIISKISTFNDEGKEEIDPTILSIFLFKYYNSKGDVKTDNIIDEFYTDETKDISRPSLAYLEDNLITGEGFRHIIPYNDALSNGVTKQELDQLIASRILTVETRKKHNYIEFSHDVICPIAKEHRERRKIDEQARKLRKRVFAATALSVFAVFLIGSFIYLRHQVKEKDRFLTKSQAINNSDRAHYMIIQGDVLDAIKLLLNIVPQSEKDIDTVILPETERVLNEAYDSLYSDYACIAILNHDDDVITAEFSEDASQIITACSDGICRIWNSSSGELLKELKCGIKGMTGASLNKDGDKAIASFSNGTAIIWDVATGDVKVTLKGHTSAVNYACFSPNGLYALTASKDSTVGLWNVKTGKFIKTLVQHADNINCAIFSTDGKKVITSSEDGSSVVYDFISNASQIVHSDKDHSVEYAEFNYDGTMIAIITNDAVYIKDAKTLKLINVLNSTSDYNGHKKLITSASFSPDGQTIATSSYDHTIKLWNIISGKVIHNYIGHLNNVMDVVFSPDGHYVLSTSTDDEARIWNVDVRKPHNIDCGDMGTLRSTTYSPNGQYIAAISYEGKARIWETKTGNVISSFEIQGTANSIVFNRQSDHVAVSAADNKIRIYNVQFGQMTDSIEIANTDGCEYVLFTDNDKSVIAFANESRSVLFNLDTRSYSYIHKDSITSLKFSPNDDVCLLASDNKPSFSIWNGIQGSCLKTFEGHAKDVCSVNYSHDSRLIVSGSSDNTAIIWDVETANTIHKLKKHSSQVYFTEFSSDDRYLITASSDGIVIVWNVETGEDVATRRPLIIPHYTYMFCPNASQYIIAYDKEICVHKLYTPENLIQHFIPRYIHPKFTTNEKDYYSIK